MKLLALLFSLVFFTFLGTPTVVVLVKKNVALDKYFSSADEEQTDNFDCNDVFFLSSQLIKSYFQKYVTTTSGKIASAVTKKVLNLTQSIFIPPPKYTIVK